MSSIITPSDAFEKHSEIGGNGQTHRLLDSLNKSVQRHNDPLSRALLPYAEAISEGPLVNLAPLLPLFFAYGGKPLTLMDHFPLEPLFDTYIPSDILLLCSRQVGKTLQMAAGSILECVITNDWDVLFVAPAYEMIRRVSTDYFVQLERESPIRALLTGKGCVKQVLERTYPNRSRVRFTYAHKSADRARGIHARALRLDERQLMDKDIIPVLKATMLSSPYKEYVFSAATPLTHSNPTSVMFRAKTTRSHWMIPCKSCGKENVAAKEADLVNMIGPWSDDISRDKPGLICANAMCGARLYPWEGRFIHLNPQLRDEALGLHVPMTVLPHHACSSERWKDLHKVLNDSTIPDYKKYNEYLGVPHDDGLVLLSENDLQRVAVLNKNRLEEALARLSIYNGRVAVGVDWGGGGISGESRTKLAVVGMHANGKLECIFGLQILNSSSRTDEARVIIHILQRVQPLWFAHDTATIGDVSEEILVNMGYPQKKIWPMSYVGETGGVLMKAASGQRAKPYYVVDKSRSLLHLAETIKTSNIAFFQMTESYNARDLLLDFTHLTIEEKVYIDSMRSNAVLVHREEGQSDDFVHAVNFARLALCTHFNAWPKFQSKLTLRTMQELATYIPAMKKALDAQSIAALQLQDDAMLQGMER